MFLPPGMVRTAPPSNIEDPDNYLVDSEIYPVFHAKEKFDPPKWKVGSGESKFPMVAIEPIDIWKVTRVVGEMYLIHSDTYNERQCRYLMEIAPDGSAGGFVSRWGRSRRCHADYLYHIPIMPNGTVRGGWKLLYNPERFLSSRDRYINLQIDPITADDWGSQPLFIPTPPAKLPRPHK